MAGIRLIGVTKRFGNITAVDKTDLTIEDKEFVVLVGPSGCGKTTTLRMIAGLEQASEGEIYIGERNVSGVLPKDRDISMVFQSYALYPHMNVFRNIGFGLRIRRFPKEEIERRVREAAAILGIEDLLERKPKELSGGQRQRVAMGRAIVRHPQAFLFDEPLSNLDAKLRVQMRGELAKLHQRLETTVVYVTHDQIEAMTLADRIVVMCDGIIKQIGRPLEVYNQPRDLFVAGFIGSPTMNLFPVEVISADGRLFAVGDGFKLAVPPDRQDRFAPAEGRPSVLGLRPEHFHEKGFKEPFPGGEAQPAVIDVVEPVGSEVILLAACGRSQLTASVDPETRVRPGDQVEFLVDMNRMHLFDQATERAY